MGVEWGGAWVAGGARQKLQWAMKLAGRPTWAKEKKKMGPDDGLLFP